MERLEYKGYFGSIEYSKGDNCLFGEILGLDKKCCITYEGNTADELYNDFKEGVDHYLEYCKTEGIKPQKPFNDMLNIRIPSEIHNKVARYAENHGISINAFVRDSIERGLELIH